MDPGATSLVVPDDNPIKSKYDGHMNDSDPFYLQDEDPESLEPDPILDRSKPKTPSSNIAQFTQSKSKLPEQEHQQLVNSHRRKRRWDDAQSHSNDFIDWFQEKVQREQVDGQLFWLAKGPNTKARRYMGYFVNGYRFCTKGRDSRIKTQNSGVTLIATTSSFSSSRDQNPVDEDVTYYGVIEEIIELDFWSQFSVVLFKCQWFLANVDEFGLTFVNFKKKCSQSDPFVLASQVHQVFYVQDPQEHDIHYVMQRVPRDLFDFEEAMNEEPYWEEAMDSSGSDIPNVDASDTYSRASGEVRSVEITDIEDALDITYHEEDFEHDDTDWDWMHADTDT
ncbi:hypothetical protein BVRB_6g139850 [Beta vulgaris subsp. vulgaris]|nr:hypothetical protein BVRB_6g139850 [Beta vulgaris subsp. vulgaris]